MHLFRCAHELKCYFACCASQTAAAVERCKQRFAQHLRSGRAALVRQLAQGKRDLAILRARVTHVVQKTKMQTASAWLGQLARCKRNLVAKKGACIASLQRTKRSISRIRRAYLSYCRERMQTLRTRAARLLQKMQSRGLAIVSQILKVLRAKNKSIRNYAHRCKRNLVAKKVACIASLQRTKRSISRIRRAYLSYCCERMRKLRTQGLTVVSQILKVLQAKNKSIRNYAHRCKRNLVAKKVACIASLQRAKRSISRIRRAYLSYCRERMQTLRTQGLIVVSQILKVLQATNKSIRHYAHRCKRNLVALPMRTARLLQEIKTQRAQWLQALNKREKTICNCALRWYRDWLEQVARCERKFTLFHTHAVHTLIKAKVECLKTLRQACKEGRRSIQLRYMRLLETVHAKKEACIASLQRAKRSISRIRRMYLSYCRERMQQLRTQFLKVLQAKNKSIRNYAHKWHRVCLGQLARCKRNLVVLPTRTARLLQEVKTQRAQWLQALNKREKTICNCALRWYRDWLKQVARCERKFTLFHTHAVHALVKAKVMCLKTLRQAREEGRRSIQLRYMRLLETLHTKKEACIASLQCAKRSISRIRRAYLFYCRERMQQLRTRAARLLQKMQSRGLTVVSQILKALQAKNKSIRNYAHKEHRVCLGQLAQCKRNLVAKKGACIASLQCAKRSISRIRRTYLSYCRERMRKLRTQGLTVVSQILKALREKNKSIRNLGQLAQCKRSAKRSIFRIRRAYLSYCHERMRKLRTQGLTVVSQILKVLQAKNHSIRNYAHRYKCNLVAKKGACIASLQCAKRSIFRIRRAYLSYCHERMRKLRTQGLTVVSQILKVLQAKNHSIRNYAHRYKCNLVAKKGACIASLQCAKRSIFRIRRAYLSYCRERMRELRTQGLTVVSQMLKVLQAKNNSIRNYAHKGHRVCLRQLARYKRNLVVLPMRTARLLQDIKTQRAQWLQALNKRKKTICNCALRWYRDWLEQVARCERKFVLFYTHALVKAKNEYSLQGIEKHLQRCRRGFCRRRDELGAETERVLKAGVKSVKDLKDPFSSYFGLFRLIPQKKGFVAVCCLAAAIVPAFFIWKQERRVPSTPKSRSAQFFGVDSSLKSDKLLCLNEGPLKGGFAYDDTFATDSLLFFQEVELPPPPAPVARTVRQESSSIAVANDRLIASATSESLLTSSSLHGKPDTSGQQSTSEPIPQRLSLSNTQATNDGFGDVQSYWSLNMMLAPTFKPNHYMPFIDLRWNTVNDCRDSNKFAGNLGVGVRHIPQNCGPIWGGNIYYDYRHSSVGSGWNQIGLGLEIFGNVWELRANVYLPIGSKLHEHKCKFDDFNGDFTMVERKFEFMYTGFDTEVGCRAVATEDYTVYIGTGPYYIDGRFGHQAWGIRVRFRPQYKDYVALDVMMTHDHIFQTIYQGELILSLPFYALGSQKNKKPPCGITQRQIYQPVQRLDVIPVSRKREWSQNF